MNPLDPFLDIREIVRRLNSGLGTTLVGGLAGSTVQGISHQWQKSNGPEPSPEAQERLRLAHRAWTAVSSAEGEHVARLWFIGSNPWLRGDSPIDAIREIHSKNVMEAAKAMVEGRFSG